MQFYAFNDGGQTFYVQGSNPMNALAALRNWLQSRGWGATDVASVSERDLQPVSEQGVNKGYLVNANQTVTAGGGQEKFSFGGGSSGGKGASASFGTGTGTGGNAFGSYLSEDDDLGMTGAYRRALAGRGVKFNNIAGRSLLDQQGRYEAPFTALQAAGIDQTTDPDAFYNYVGAGANPYEKGKAAFSQIYNASRGADPTAQIQEFSVPTTTTGYANAGNVARGALGRAGNFVSDRLLSGVRDEYAALPSDQTTNYLDYLRKRLGIQGF